MARFIAGRCIVIQIGPSCQHTAIARNSDSDSKLVTCGLANEDATEWTPSMNNCLQLSADHHFLRTRTHIRISISIDFLMLLLVRLPSLPDESLFVVEIVLDENGQ